VPLLARRFSVRFQNRVDEIDRLLQLPSRPLRLLPRLRQRAADRFAHHPAMHAQLRGHAHDGPDPELVLPADLLE
jgi:hypothetical protein